MHNIFVRDSEGRQGWGVRLVLCVVNKAITPASMTHPSRSHRQLHHSGNRHDSDASETRPTLLLRQHSNRYTHRQGREYLE